MQHLYYLQKSSVHINILRLVSERRKCLLLGEVLRDVLCISQPCLGYIAKAKVPEFIPRIVKTNF